jgi:hypothetical protein
LFKNFFLHLVFSLYTPPFTAELLCTALDWIELCLDSRLVLIS